MVKVLPMFQEESLKRKKEKILIRAVRQINHRRLFSIYDYLVYLDRLDSIVRFN